MTNPKLRILPFQMALSEEQVEGQWTQTASHTEACVTQSPDDSEVCGPKMVTVRFKDLIDTLAGSTARRPAWFQDFDDDPVSVTQDLFDVLVAYRAMRRAA